MLNGSRQTGKGVESPWIENAAERLFDRVTRMSPRFVILERNYALNEPLPWLSFLGPLPLIAVENLKFVPRAEAKQDD